MRFKAISFYLGRVILLLTVAMATSVIVALVFKEDLKPFAVSVPLSLAVCAGLSICGKYSDVQRKDAFGIVSLAWVLAGVLGAIPYFVSGTIPDFISAFFESISGFTTTGASVIKDVESIPKSILYWRALTQWLGGMGIIVLFVAVFPEIGIGMRHLFEFEVTGPVPEAVRPGIKETASILWKIYAGLTFAEFVLLILAGMGPYDALCHTFTTMPTGGFSTRNLSIGTFGNIKVEVVIMIFMFLAGANFSLYQLVLRGEIGSVLRSRELWLYTALVLGACLVISILTLPIHGSFFKALRYGSFQAISIATTSGYSTDNFDTYSPSAKLILLGLMFIGGCVGSTASGLKVVRLLILLKVALRRVRKEISPKEVRTIRLGSTAIPESFVESVLTFFFLYLLIFALASFVISLYGFDIATSVSAVAASIGNVGPGFSSVGPLKNYACIPPFGKLILTTCMIFGRLELFTVLAFFHPRAWKR